MSSKTDYPCSQALNDMDVFFKKHIHDSAELQRFLGYLDECRKEGKVGFRFIHTELMNYRKLHSDYFFISEEEKEMIDDLFYFWG